MLWRDCQPLGMIVCHHILGAPPIVASGSLSIVYLRDCRYMMGTPGIFRIRLLKSRSQVATM